MKKWAVLLIVALFASHGLVFAANAETDVQAKAEPVMIDEMVADEVIDPATDEVVEEDVMEDEELYMPSMDSEAGE